MIFILIAAGFVALPGILTGKSLTLSGPDDSIARVSGQVLTAAYKKLGIQLTLKYSPAERSIQDSNRNLHGISGEINRILAVKETYKNLIPVMIPINRIEGVAFAKNRDISLEKGWESLRPYKIGVRIGTKFAEKNTVGMNVSKSPSNKSLFSMLNSNRIQVVVTSRTEGLAEISRNSEFKKLHPLSPPLINVPLYHFLHKSKKELIPHIELVLRGMQEAGDLEKIKAEALSDL